MLAWVGNQVGDRGTNFLLRCFRCLIECIVVAFLVAVVVAVTVAIVAVAAHPHQRNYLGRGLRRHRLPLLNTNTHGHTHMSRSYYLKRMSGPAHSGANRTKHEVKLLNLYDI